MPFLPAGEISVDAPRRRLGFGVCLWTLLLGLSLWRWPIPGINEPHYLGKARHLLDPTWCAGDFFLESSNPHYVTSFLLGLLTRIFDLATATLLGRAAAFAAVAWGWTSLLRGLPGPPQNEFGLSTRQALRARDIAITVLFLVLQILGNWSGEWLLRGVEGKVFAWGFLFLAIGSASRANWVWTAFALGLSVTFHPVIGAWGTICIGMASVWSGFVSVESSSHASEPNSLFPQPARRDRLSWPGWRTVLGAGMTFSILAAPGVIASLPALRMGTSEERWQADHIQVTQRLAHHLDPLTFAWTNHREYLLLLGLIWLLKRPRSDRSFVERVTWMAVLCAVAGIGISLWPRTTDHFSWYVLRLKLLKLYPFRVADLLIPVLCAVRIVESPRMSQVLFSRHAETVSRQEGNVSVEPVVPGELNSVTTQPNLRVRGSGLVPRAALSLTGLNFTALMTFSGLILFCFLWPGGEPPVGGMSPESLPHWQETLLWIRDTTPPSSQIQSMNESYAVKWYAERPEYVNYKDCPQDAPGILEWHSRLLALDAWKLEAMRDSIVTSAELRALRQQTGITHLICSRFGPVAAEPIFQSGDFRVYQTEPASSSIELPSRPTTQEKR